mmetsp:Transcript_32786/g.37490  ORF Transcript_32786/g.37490 Transcript_32786/m.37490 type:complete len:207 (-) Transcript_32786:430-1050(-)
MVWLSHSNKFRGLFGKLGSLNMASSSSSNICSSSRDSCIIFSCLSFISSAFLLTLFFFLSFLLALFLPSLHFSLSSWISLSLDCNMLNRLALSSFDNSASLVSLDLLSSILNVVKMFFMKSEFMSENGVSFPPFCETSRDLHLLCELLLIGVTHSSSYFSRCSSLNLLSTFFISLSMPLESSLTCSKVLPISPSNSLMNLEACLLM